MSIGVYKGLIEVFYSQEREATRGILRLLYTILLFSFRSSTLFRLSSPVLKGVFFFVDVALR